MDKIPITVILPVKNEEVNLQRSLPLLTVFDQILLVDSNSTDNTVNVAHDYRVEVHQFNWNGHFPKKRNWALRNLAIRNDWVLFLDADEYVTEAFLSEIQEKIKDPFVNSYWVSYWNYFMGKQLRYGDTLKKLPLFRVGKGEYERIEEDSWSHLDMEVHEHPIITGKVGYIKARIIHNGYRNLEHYINRHNAYASWESTRFSRLKKDGFKNLTQRQKLKYRLMQLGLLPFVYFVGCFFVKLGFLDGKPGYFFAKYKALYFLQIRKISKQKQ